MMLMMRLIKSMGIWSVEVTLWLGNSKIIDSNPAANFVPKHSIIANFDASVLPLETFLSM